MALTQAVHDALEWLRGGYPAGVPSEDRLALLGILHRHLTEQEIDEIALALKAEHESPYTDEEISARIHETALEQPSQEDVRRVAARLAAGGWPLGDLKDAR